MIKEVRVEVPIRVPVEYEKKVDVPVIHETIKEVPVETHTTETHAVEVVKDIAKHLTREVGNQSSNMGLHRMEEHAGAYLKLPCTFCFGS